MNINTPNVLLYFIKISIFTAFCVHAFIVAYDLIYPEGTVLRFEQRSLDDIEFPIVLKICINPAFNISELQEVGYQNVWDYFTGKSKYSDYGIFGWSGHAKNGSIISNVKGHFSKYFVPRLYYINMHFITTTTKKLKVTF